MTSITNILTPVGRLVQGDCFEAQTKDAEGNPLTIKFGANAGQPRVDYYMGIAIPKTDPGWAETWGLIHGVARASAPSLFDASGNCVSPKFAFKIIDGDSVVPNTKGKKPCEREGFPGNWILNFSGGFAPKCYTAGGETLINDPQMLKRGYYVRIYGSVKGNGSTQQPGIFLNHTMVELVGYGEEIVIGQSGDAVFGASPAAALPAGASATPLAGSAPLAQGPAMAPPAQGPAQGPAMAPPAQGPAQAPPSNVAPAPDFLQGPAPATAPAPAPAPAPAEVKYLDANGTPWTEAELVDVGYSVPQIHALPRA